MTWPDTLSGMVAADLPEPPSRRLRAALDANLQLLALADRLQEHWSLCARQHGLSGAQIKALLNIASGEHVTMRVLAGRIGYDASNLTGLVDRLEDAGLLERGADAADRRTTRLTLTTEGKRVRDDFWRTLNASGPLDSLTSAQLDAMIDVLHCALEDDIGTRRGGR